MNAVYPVLLLIAAPTATVLGATVLVAVRGLRREVATLREQVGVVPDPAAERARIREAVSEALAEERERELAEARAYWAAREAADGEQAAFPEGALADLLPDGSAEEAFAASELPADFRAEFERQFGDALREAIEELTVEEATAVVRDLDDAEEAGATVPDPRRHPSHPDFRPGPTVADRERTLAGLEALAASGTPLSDVRPGPLGTLDVYVFADTTTVCVTPGDRAATGRLAEALRGGETALLMGGCEVGGGYTLTFGVGQERVFVLADRVVTSL
ncbi:hypothetical protein GCM10027168_33470 [Streptomyces capparidis]